MSTWKWAAESCGEEGTCNVCGEKPDASWVGKKRINICSKCAFDIFPKLMADAVANRILNHPINKNLQIAAFQAMLKEAESNYWYGAACQLLLAIKREDESHDDD